MLTSLSTTIAAAAAHLPADTVAHGNGFAFWPFFLVFPLFWILVVGFFVFFGRRMWRRNRQWAATQGAEGVLRERYARGEIDETEYRQRLEVLRAHTEA
ncbi:SHOCT domain-containing protein [Arthrobacter sp. NyZ413]|uniref:SHOCT domain-containing protein n=1 Tax=Arthrobacter sp. NyZ413 TaxID=3144669 RepID=UPI003BF8BE00